MSEPPSAPTSDPPARVMLLSLHGAPGPGWHARVIEADATVHDFDSPFELVRYLSRPERSSQPGPGGLR